MRISQPIQQGRRLLTHYGSSRVGARSVPLAVYDLNCNPATFDFVAFLIAAERYFLERGDNVFDLVIVRRGEDQSLHLESIDAAFSRDSEEWKVQNILAPAAMMSRAVGSLSLKHSQWILEERAEKDTTFPPGVSPNWNPMWDHKSVFSSDLPQAFQGLAAPSWGINRVEQWLRLRRIEQPFVVVTIRARAFDQTRNTDLSVVRHYQDWLRSIGVALVVVPDTEDPSSLHGISEFVCFELGSWNLQLRLSLYSMAQASFFLSNGPSALVFACRQATGVVFSPIIPESRFSTTAQHHAVALRPEDGRQAWDRGRFSYVFEDFTLGGLISESIRLVSNRLNS